MKVLESKNDKQIMWIQIHDIIALNERHITLPSVYISFIFTIYDYHLLFSSHLEEQIHSLQIL